MASLDDLYTLIKEFIDKQDTASSGTTVVPYQEFTYTIPVSGRQEIFNTYNYFRVLSLNLATLSVKFGDNGIETPYTGAGVGVNLGETFARLTLINTGASPITITVAVAIGSVNDDRLNVSGTINVTSSTAAPVINVATTGAATNSVVSVTNAATQIVPSNSVRGSLLFRNQGAVYIFVGSSAAVTTANGVLVKAGEFFSSTTRGAVFGITAAGSSNVGIWEEAR